MIQSALGKPELIVALTPSGYDANELQAGLALQREAQARFSARQAAVGAAAQAKVARDAALAEAKDEFAAYRATVQANYKSGDRAGLAATGKVPDDIEKFRTLARGAYTAAQNPPYAAALSKNGFAATRFADALTALDALADSDIAFKKADRDATQSTVDRNQAVAALEEWASKFRKLAKVALRKDPTNRSALGV